MICSAVQSLHQGSLFFFFLKRRDVTVTQKLKVKHPLNTWSDEWI